MKSVAVLSFSVVALTLAGCSFGTQPVWQTFHKDPEKLVSSQPTKKEIDVFIMILNEAPLLSDSKRSKDGQLIVDKTRAAAVEKEQQDMIVALNQISPEIKVLFRYKQVLNGLALVLPPETQEQVLSMKGAQSVTKTVNIRAHKTVTMGKSVPNSRLLEANSSKFIGAVDAWALFTGNRGQSNTPLRGEGIRVGVLDTGVDYTHKMLGGSGVPDDFSNIDPNVADPQFPTAKVDGYDFIGAADFNSKDPMMKIPKPDPNPIDEEGQGHGTHVAGTIAGIGDYVSSYNGVAPAAKIYSLRVLAKGGGPLESILAAIEYSADPNKDGDANDRLDVINMSLGAPFGLPENLYNQAIKHLSFAGTIVVASAGNSGDNPFITGRPGTSNDAISVAASIDDTFHNWNFQASAAVSEEGQKRLMKRVDGAISKDLSAVDFLEGELVYIGFADEELTAEQKEALKGKVALIDRGKTTFSNKLKRALGAGARAAVVANNKPGNPIVMGGDENVDIVAVMISQADGDLIKSWMESQSVRFQFVTEENLVDRSLIDQITSFSSRGPRQIDYLLKPEVAAPGQAVISAEIGTGNAVSQKNGTSMAAPHIAGVAALLRQYYPDLSARDIKSLIVNSAKSLSLSESDELYPVSRQGAGRVQVLKALTAPIVAAQSGISFGRVQTDQDFTRSRKLELKNITSQSLKLTFSYLSQSGVSVVLPKFIVINPGETRQVPMDFIFKFPTEDFHSHEADGFVRVHYGDKESSDNSFLQIPFLAYVTKSSNVKLLSVHRKGESTRVSFLNNGLFTAEILPFRWLGSDERKTGESGFHIFRTSSCDLQTAGYRVIEKTNPETQQVEPYLQVAAQLHRPVSVWEHCQLSVQIDSDGDGVAEQELSALEMRDFIEEDRSRTYVNALFDAPKVRELRVAYESAVLENQEEAKEDYSEAILAASPLAPRNHSTLIITEAPLEKVAKNADGGTNIKVGLLDNNANVDADDFFETPLNGYQAISLQSNSGLPEAMNLGPNGIQSLAFEGVYPTIFYTPGNQWSPERAGQNQFILIDREN